MRQIEIEEKITYKALYKSKFNEIYIIHGDNKISVLGDRKVKGEYEFGECAVLTQEL